MVHVKGTEASAFAAYVAILRRRRGTVLATVLVAVALMTAYVLHKTPVYEATAQLQLTPAVSAAVLQANNATVNSAAALVDVPTAIQVIQSRSVAARADAVVGNAPPVAANQIGTTDVVTLAVRSTDNRLAERAANAYANQYIQLEHAAAASALAGAIQVLQSRITTLQQSVQAIQAQLAHASGPQALSVAAQLSSVESTQVSLRQQITVYETAAALTTGGGIVVGPAQLPHTAVLPKPAEYIVLAALLGLFAGIGLALTQEKLDEKVRFPEDVEATLGPIPVIAVIPSVNARRTAPVPLVARDDPRAPAAEAYRILRASVRFIQVDRSLKLIQITSPRVGDGKTTTLANLAVTMAQAGQRVVVVDCDLRRPQLHALFGLANNVGFTSILLGDASIENAVVNVPEIENLRFLPSGPVPPFPSELLSGSGADLILRSLADDSDVVLIDSPPVLPVADATVLASHVDALLLVAGAGISSRKDIAAALASAARLNAPVRGFVLNRGISAGQSYDGYYGAHPDPPATGRDEVASAYSASVQD